MTQRNLILGVLAVIGFGGAGVMFLRGGSASPEVADTAREYALCLDCQEEGWVEFPRGERAPHKCPKCGDTAAFSLFYCYHCKQRFIPPLERSEPASPLRAPLIVTACPDCGSSTVMLYIPGEMGEEPLGDAAPPAWP